MINNFIKSHGGKFSCPYCIGEATFDVDQLRSFGHLKECILEYEKAGRPHKDMKNFKVLVYFFLFTNSFFYSAHFPIL